MSIQEIEKEFRELRMLARHFRDIGMPQLMHAAYRSARARIQDYREKSR